MKIPAHAMHPEWLKELKAEFEKPYMSELSHFIKTERHAGKAIYPEAGNVFKALKPITPEDVKVVIVGQDPYHNPGQAHGLSFSVPEGLKAPPSLQNIFKELKADLNVKVNGTDLTPWTDQGVLLLNSMLTVEKNKPGSHQKKGWELFTDEVLKIVDKRSEHSVFILWGSYAQKKGDFINSEKHLVLKSPHPSPFSAYRGFFGSKPFSKVNAFLEEKGLKPINW
jgi:uracil-DNA glycosylase